MIKISVIVPSFNQGKYIEDTLLSIINQNYPNYEIIIMDGGSTDNTVEVIKKYQDYIAYWQSEKDNGQSDAINAGFRKATGDIVTWLNSDDVLLSGALAKVDEYANRYPDINWFLANVLWMDKRGNVIKVGKVEKESNFWNKRHLFSNGGPTAFMRREHLLSIGSLRMDFHYQMDTELWHRYISTGNMFKRLPCYCWGLRVHEEAKTTGGYFSDSPLADKNHPSWQRMKQERGYIQSEYLPSPVMQKIWRLLKLFRSSYYTRYFDRTLIGQNYKDIKSE